MIYFPQRLTIHHQMRETQRPAELALSILSSEANRPESFSELKRTSSNKELLRILEIFCEIQTPDSSALPENLRQYFIDRFERIIPDQGKRETPAAQASNAKTARQKLLAFLKGIRPSEDPNGSFLLLHAPGLPNEYAISVRREADGRIVAENGDTYIPTSTSASIYETFSHIGSNGAQTGIMENIAQHEESTMVSAYYL